MRFRPGLVPAVAALALAAVSGACSPSRSFIVLTLRSLDATTTIPGVTAVEVTVSQAPSFSKTLTYPTASGMSLTLDQSNTNTLSVRFTGARSGSVVLAVRVLDASGCAVGSSDASVAIHQGDIASAILFFTAEHDCSTTTDGGVTIPDGGTFPGCDPAEPIACSPGQTCQVNCKTERGECTDGGTGNPGAACVTNADCAPGSQCFDYSGTGCPVRVCLRFCNGDNQCLASSTGADAGGGDGGHADGGAASASATGTTSVCEGEVPCGMVTTGYHTCTFACDPRAAAVTANSTRCPTGLACLVVGDMDQVDCTCAGASHTGTDGTPCTTGAECAPGFICNIMASTKTCRAVCRCDASGMQCTAPNDCPGTKTCSALTKDTVFGVCL